MKNFLKRNKWIQEYFGEHVETKMKIYRMIFAMAAAGLTIDILFNFFIMHERTFNILMPFIGLMSVIGALWVSKRIKNGETAFFILLLVANIVIFPLAFLFGGGIGSGEAMWMLLGLLLTFLLLNGWRFYVTAIYTVVAIITTHIVYILNPDIMGTATIENRQMLQTGSLVSLLTIGFIAGILYRYQNSIYEKQRKLAEKRQQEIEDSANSKSLFFANMSHEIRTPINTIIGLNEMILREDVSDEVAENAINIQNASKILLALINDILDLSKIESGKMEIVPTQYETASMFSDLVNIMWVRATQKGLDFKIDISEDIPSMLYGDEVRIKQVLTNILTNAVKYTEKGSVTLTVTGEQPDNNNIRLKIAVEDTGIGIKKENMADLFTVFKRVDQEKTKKIEGTGLGLSISKQLVDMMGGTIKVDSIYQKGSTFTVTLNQQIVDNSPIGSMRYAVKRNLKDREMYHQSFEAPDAKVLVVDDNEMNLLVAKKLLRDTKIQVDTASSGKECLKKTKDSYYHVILMDHMMPEMNGEETLEKLRTRQDGYCQKSPVIALTANVMSNAAEWYRGKGFDGYLAKPISGSLLEATLIKFLPNELIEYGSEAVDDSNEAQISSMMFHNKKKKICICAECVCDLPQEWIDKFDIKIMYYYITTEEGRFIDTREIESEELIEYLAKGKSAKATCASAEEYEAFFADRLMEAEQVILITVAAGLNEGYKFATQVAKNFDNVTVFNSGHLSSGMGLMVLYAAQMAADGAETEQIIKKLTKLRDKVSTSFIVQNVDNMYQSGRVSRRVRDICNALQLRPVLHMSQNKIKVKGFRIGKMEVANKSYVKAQLRGKKIDERIAFVTHTGLSMKQMEDVKNEILKHKHFEVIKFQKASATISSNCGVGTFGVLFMRK